jgi:hypothetical protein
VNSPSKSEAPANATVDTDSVAYADARASSPCKRANAPVDSATVAFRCSLLSLSVLALAALIYLVTATAVNPRQQLPSPFHIFPAVTLNSRTIKIRLLRQYNAKAPVTGIIMGSSTSLRMSPELFQHITGDRFFNAGVFMASPLDFLAQYRLFKRENIRPKILIVGLDASSLRQAPEWNELKASWPLQTALDPTRTGWFFYIMHWVRTYGDTFSVAYADEVHSSIWAYLHRIPPSMVFLPDGRIDYIGWDRDVAEHPNRDSEIDACTDLDMSWMSSRVILSATQQHALEELVREVRTDDVDLRLWITPHHPQFFARVAKSPEVAGNLRRVRAYVTGLGRSFGIPVYDLSHESAFRGDPADWYDCSHFRDANARRIANQLMSSPSNTSASTTINQDASTR